MSQISKQIQRETGKPKKKRKSQEIRTLGRYRKKPSTIKKREKVSYTKRTVKLVRIVNR